MAKTKLKLKAKSKTKLKSKTKSKSALKPKKKLANKSLIKKKPKIKKKIPTKKKRSRTVSKKHPAKKKVKARKSSNKPKLKTKSKLIPNVKSKYPLSDTQKEELLTTIEKIIHLHKFDEGGLKSLTKIEIILDKYNQKYTEAGEKFDAIVDYGMEENPSRVREHVFVATQGKDKETLDLYKLLVDVGKGKIKFAEIKKRIEDLYADALESRR